MIFTILLGLLGLDIVVLVHELGHLVVAKLSGIDVEAFSIGMGKKLIFFTWKGTEYRLSMLPVGGYCKMKGEEQFSRALKEKADVIPYEEGSLFSVAPFKRIATYFAGPFANFLFSIFVMSLIWFMGFTLHTYSNRIVLISDYPMIFHSQQNPADTAGLKTGDTIIRINNHMIRSYADIQEIVYKSALKILHFTVLRGKKKIQLKITPSLDKDSGAGKIGVSPYIEPVVSKVAPDSAAALAGIQPGDRFISVNGQKVNNYLDIYTAFISFPGSIVLGIQSKGKLTQKSIIPFYDKKENPDIGITFESSTLRQGKLGPIQSLFHGTADTFNNLMLTFKSLGLLFSGVNLKKAVSGPIRITYFVGEVATENFKNGFKTGMTALSRFLSIISVALGFANLLPIPIFDGGLILFTVLSLIIRKPIKPAVYYRYQSIGVFFLLIIFFLTTFSDLSFLFSKG